MTKKQLIQKIEALLNLHSICKPENCDLHDDLYYLLEDDKKEKKNES